MTNRRPNAVSVVRIGGCWTTVSLRLIVQRIGKIIVLFNDTSMKFCMQLEYIPRNIFSYRAT